MLPVIRAEWRGDGRAETEPVVGIDGLVCYGNQCRLQELSAMRESVPRPYFFPFAPAFPSAPFSDLPDVPFFSSLPPSSLVLTSTS